MGTTLLFFALVFVVTIVDLCLALWLLSKHCVAKYAYRPVNAGTLLLAFIALLCLIVGMEFRVSTPTGAMALTANAVVFFAVALLLQVGLIRLLTKKANLAIGIGVSGCLFFLSIGLFFTVYLLVIVIVFGYLLRGVKFLFTHRHK